MDNFETELETLDNVPSDFHAFYAETDGKFTLRNDDVVTNAVKGITGLNKALKAARNDAKQFKGAAVDLSDLADFGQTPAEIKAAFDTKIAELQDAANSGNSKAKLDLDKIRAEFAQQKVKDEEAAKAQTGQLQSQLYNMLVINDANTAIAGLKGNSQLLMPHVKAQTKVQEENGQQVVVVVDESNSIRVNPATQLPMTVKELVEEMKASEAFAPAFASEARTGTGHPPRQQAAVGRPAGTPAINSVDKISQGLAQGLHKAQGTIN